MAGSLLLLLLLVIIVIVIIIIIIIDMYIYFIGCMNGVFTVKIAVKVKNIVILIFEFPLSFLVALILSIFKSSTRFSVTVQRTYSL